MNKHRDVFQLTPDEVALGVAGKRKKEMDAAVAAGAEVRGYETYDKWKKALGKLGVSYAGEGNATMPDEGGPMETDEYQIN